MLLLRKHPLLRRSSPCEFVSLRKRLFGLIILRSHRRRRGHDKIDKKNDSPAGWKTYAWPFLISTIQSLHVSNEREARFWGDAAPAPARTTLERKKQLPTRMLTLLSPKVSINSHTGEHNQSMPSGQNRHNPRNITGAKV